MKVALGQFACSGIETQIGDDIPAGVRKALFHYTGKLNAGRRPLAVPRFLAGEKRGGEAMAFDLPVDAKTEALIEREATLQHTTASQLIGHMVLIYLAELDFLGAPSRTRLRR